MWWRLLISRVTGDTGGLIMRFFTKNKHRLVGPTTVKLFTLYWLGKRIILGITMFL